MATIKIDHGFTQKIHQKELTRAPGQAAVPGAKKEAAKKKGWPVGVIIACAAGAVVLLAVIAGLTAGGKDKKKPAQPVIVAPAAAGANQAGEETVAKPAEEGKIDVPDADMELYANYKPKIVTNPPSYWTQNKSPVQRDVPVGSPNGLLCEYFEKIPGKAINSLRASADFPSHPTRTVQVSNFELSENIGNQYGVRVRGFLAPSASGKYRFSVCGDDGVELWLSDDDTPSRLKKRVSYGAFVPKNQWAARQDQQSDECELTAGRRYYLEAFLKEENGDDYLSVAWKGPVSGQYKVIDAQYLVPWSDAAAAPAVAEKAAEHPNLRKIREEAQAPARAAIEEQQRKNGAAYRYAEAADALKKGKSAWSDPQAQALVETAILRFELLARLRAFVQSALAKAPVRGVWTAFGKPADVTTATDEGVTVAPGRIVEWARISPDQMLKLVNALVPKAITDPTTKGTLFLAAAVLNKEASLEVALKYRERALSNHAGLASLADRVLGGTPESLQAEISMKTIRAELERLASSVPALAEKQKKAQEDLAAATGFVPGVLAEYWDQNPYWSLDEARKKGLLKKQPDGVKVLNMLESLRDRADKYVGRLSGYLTPPETDEYYFYVTADDFGELWLSPDETPEKLARIVKTEMYCNYRVWDKEKRRSKPVRLVKGQRYSVEAYLLEGEKSDHLSVAWSTVANDTPKVVEAANLLFSAPAGFTPQMRELRRQTEADLQKFQTLLSECDRAREADRSWLDSDQTASAAAADELQRQVNGVKEALRSAENLISQADAAIQQLKAAARPS